MNSISPTANTRFNVLASFTATGALFLALGLLASFTATGALVLALGFLIWDLILATAMVLSFLLAPSHRYRPSHRPWELLNTDWALTILYSGAFFTAAFWVARQRWSYRPCMATFVAHAAFLAIYLPLLDRSQTFSYQDLLLFAPLVTSPLGGILGQRASTNIQSA
jgi:hypothetical protein